MVEVDGHVYHDESEAPDLGSLMCVNTNGRIREYEGQYADVRKLPKYDDLATGSSAFLSDEGDFKLFKFYANSKTWEGGDKEVY